MIIFLVLATGFWLIAENQVNDFLKFAQSQQSEILSADSVKIAYAMAPANFDPFKANPESREKLVDVYQTLVKFDSDFAIKPSLALSWGLKGETDWYFWLRPGVKFHNGRTLTAEDVLYSFTLARDENNSDWHELLNNVQEVKKISELELLLTLDQPDALFLSKLTKIPIVPANFTDFSRPIGTGPYKVFDFRNPNKLLLQRFEDYYQEKPFFEKVEMLSIADKNARIEALTSGKVDFLVNVPPDAVANLQNKKLPLTFIPSLEVGFLMFNSSESLFANVDFRKAIAKALDKNEFLALVLGYATTQNQFVSNGVFGYNPEILNSETDRSAIKTFIEGQKDQFTRPQIDFYYPENLRLLGQFVLEQFADFGIQVNLMPQAPAEMLALITKGNLPFYYLGWRSDLGDSLPFFTSVIHSRTASGKFGDYNANNLQNSELDQQIEQAMRENNVKKRLKIQQELMKTIVEDQVVGVPLFETQSIYAYHSKLVFNSRVDGVVYPSELNMIQ